MLYDPKRSNLKYDPIVTQNKNFSIYNLKTRYLVIKKDLIVDIYSLSFFVYDVFLFRKNTRIKKNAVNEKTHAVYTNLHQNLEIIEFACKM
jgi:hypothetical protein